MSYKPLKVWTAEDFKVFRESLDDDTRFCLEEYIASAFVKPLLAANKQVYEHEWEQSSRNGWLMDGR